MQKWGGQDKFLSALPRPPAGPYAVEKLLPAKLAEIKSRQRLHSFVEESFDTVGDEDWIPRYNVAPTQPVPIIRQNSKEPRRELSPHQSLEITLTSLIGGEFEAGDKSPQ
jgi:hypothetical protein